MGFKLYRHRVNYWSNGNFARWLAPAQCKKPTAATRSDWLRWRMNYRDAAPIRYWLTETLFNRLQNVVYFPSDLYGSIRAYILNRFVHRLHLLKSNTLERGVFYDYEARLLFCVFDSFMDYCENEFPQTVLGKNSGRFMTGENRFDNAIFTNKHRIEQRISTLSGLMENEPHRHEVELEELNRARVHTFELQSLYHWWKDYRNEPRDSTNIGVIELENENLRRLFKLRSNLQN